MVSPFLDGTIVGDVLSILKEDQEDLPTPDSIVLPIFQENFYLSILIGTALIHTGHWSLCKGTGKYPDKCLFNPDLPEKYLSRSEIPEYYSTKRIVPEDLKNPYFFRAYLYDNGICLELVPSQNVEVGKLEFHCNCNF